MALPGSGAISLGQVSTELGLSSTSARSLGESTTRTLLGVSSGTISLSHGYGKANQFAFFVSSNQTNADLRTLAVNAGWNQSTKVFATINSGIIVSSNSTLSPGLTINGSFPGGVELVNNGFILGMGGAGGAGSEAVSEQNSGKAGAAGGNALLVSVAVSIRNNQTIGGGGGGGGGGGKSWYDFGTYVGSAAGGGGGGGRTGETDTPGGRGGVYASLYGLAGGAGTVNAAGVGGRGSLNPATNAGGSGGNWGSSGGAGGNGPYPNVYGGAGGSGGMAVSGNEHITWLAIGTRLGAIT